MTMAAAGLAKLIEECGELTQVCGKRLAMWDQDDHWDGTNLRVRMQEEIADVRAALTFVEGQFKLDRGAIAQRTVAKILAFVEWEADIANNDHGIDAPRAAA